MKYLWLLMAFLPLLTRATSADEFFEAEHGCEPNHLTPLDYPPNAYDWRISEYLFLTHGRFGRFIARPSFGAESCVSVHDQIPGEARKEHGDPLAETKGKYFITVTRAEEPLWSSMADPKDDKGPKKVKVSRIDREISLELAVAIQRAWGRMLQQTKYPAQSSRGLDGATYQFSVWVRGFGELHGQTWSPESGLPAEMVFLGNELATFASDKNAAERPIIDKLKAFEAKIPKA